MANEEHGAAERDAPSEEPEPLEQPEKTARAVPARKRGLFARTGDAVSERLGRLRPPPLDWRAFSYGLLALIAIILIARNWDPVRMDLFGWRPDVPKAIAFLFFFALGVFGAWLWNFRAQRLRDSATSERRGPADAEGDATEEEATDDEDLAF